MDKVKVLITQSMIENASEWDIIASGIFNNNCREVHLTDNLKARRQVRWVAVRGVIRDWAVYSEDLFTDMQGFEDISDHRDDDFIVERWHKVSLFRLDRFLELDDEAKQSYRRY